MEPFIINNYADRVSRQSFILDVDNLQRLYDLGVNWVDNGEDSKVCLCEAHCKQTSEIISSESIEPILKYGNNKQQQIYIISLIMKAGKNRAFRLRIQRDPDWPTLLFEVHGEDHETSKKMYQDVSAELKETTQWYSFLSNRVKLHSITSKYGWIWMTVFVLLFLYGLGSGIFNYYHGKNIANQNLSTLVEDKQEIERRLSGDITEDEQQELSQLDEKLAQCIGVYEGILNRNYLPVVLKLLIIGVVCFFVGYFGNRFLLYLFPRGTVLIGAEIKRHDKLLKVRKYIWMASVTIVGTVIAGMILNAMFH